MNRIKFFNILFLAIIVVTMSSCGGCLKLFSLASKTARPVAKTSQALKYSRAMRGANNLIAMKALSGSGFEAMEVGGTLVAKNAAKVSKIQMKVYKPSGRVIDLVETTVDISSSIITDDEEEEEEEEENKDFGSERVLEMFHRMEAYQYKKNIVDNLDEIFVKVHELGLSTEKELEKTIDETVMINIRHENDYTFNASSGELLLDNTNAYGDRMYASVNMYEAVKRAVVIGNEGYYEVKGKE